MGKEERGYITGNNLGQPDEWFIGATKGFVDIVRSGLGAHEYTIIKLDEMSRVWLLEQLIQRFPPDERQKIIKDALAEAEAIDEQQGT